MAARVWRVECRRVRRTAEETRGLVGVEGERRRLRRRPQQGRRSMENKVARARKVDGPCCCCCCCWLPFCGWLSRLGVSVLSIGGSVLMLLAILPLMSALEPEGLLGSTDVCTGRLTLVLLLLPVLLRRETARFWWRKIRKRRMA